MASVELQALQRLSAKIGSDPLLVQAAGGNTSLKEDGVMWIKASGTWLKDALASDIFVPLDMADLSAALAANSPACESCVDFVRQDINPNGLRPSIETSVHGLMPHAVVVHVHCVNTIAQAIQTNARDLFAARLKNFRWAFVPYARPGLQLSQAIQNSVGPGVNVLVLQNHGLVVAANTVADAENLLRDVVMALKMMPRAFGAPDFGKLERVVEGTAYTLPQDQAAHLIALDEWSRKMATDNVYYPDHAVFLGTSIPSDFAASAVAVAIPGAGVVIRKEAKPAVEPMLVCLANVFRRLAPDCTLKALTSDEVAQLLNWDAEKYRQTLKQ